MNKINRHIITTATFILALTGHGAANDDSIHEIDQKIKNLRTEINDLRAQNHKMIADSLGHGKGCPYLRDTKEDIDELRRKNNEYIASAVEIAKKHSGHYVIAKNTTVFLIYSYIPAVATLRDLHNANMRRIRTFESKTRGAAVYRQSVKNHFDSIMILEINRRQLMIDSLLDTKAQKLR